MDETSTTQPQEPAVVSVYPVAPISPAPAETLPAVAPAQEPEPVANVPATAPESQTSPVQTQSAPVLSPQNPIVESPKPNFISQLLQNARKKIQERKQVRLQKILALAQSKGAITNEQVQKLLRCSDASAERYLALLEKQGRLKQVGKTGQAVRYELVK